MSIKNYEKDFNILNKLNGYRIIGIKDNIIGYDFYGNYYISDNIFFIPFYFFGIEDDGSFNTSRLPKLVANGKWRVALYKKRVITNGNKRTIIYEVNSNPLVIEKTNENIELFGFKLLDDHAKKCINQFNNKRNGFSENDWEKGSIDIKGTRPCLIREEINDSFVIEIKDYDKIYDDSHN